MVALESPQANLNWLAPSFTLKGTDGGMHSLESLKGTKGTLIVFICNHCPYVQKQLGRLTSLTTQLKMIGINVVAINPNDAVAYPDDSFEEMQKLAKEKGFNFPYLVDATQEVAKSYSAICTPDFFGFNSELKLQYRGRLDESWSHVIDNPAPELLEAMREMAQTGSTSKPQNPSIGCSIKWRRADQQAAG